jgi:hypothetical protein
MSRRLSFMASMDEYEAALVRRSAAIEPAPRGARGRVLAGVEAAVLSGVSGPGSGSASSTRPAAVGRALERGVAVAAGFVVGGALGAFVMYEHLRPVGQAAVVLPPSPPPSVATAVVEPAPAPALNAPAAPTSGSQARSRRDLPAPPATAPTPAAASTASVSHGLAEERTLLDAARAAVEREDGPGALAATEEHARKYPGGVLAQEREAIAVRALLLLGRIAEARARVSRFQASFPDSLLLPALESSVEAASAPAP